MKIAIICIALLGSGVAVFSPDGQAAIVKAHNELRSAVATGTYVAKGKHLSSASDMMEMFWDDNLAESAQRLADQCRKGHSESKHKDYGENTYTGFSSKEIEDLDSYGVMASKKWEDEFQKFGWLTNTYTNKTKPFGIGHATQMIWSKSNRVGCGAKSCGPVPKKRMNKVVVVCQYKVRGNYIDELIYEEGNTCSACPAASSCETESGLCA